MKTIHTAGAALAGLLCLLWWTCGSAAAQQPDRPAPLLGEVDVQIRSVGVGDRARPGEWAGVLVDVTDQGDRVRNIVLRLATKDPDGDTIRTQVSFTSNPGAKRPVWLYPWLPHGIESVGVLTVTAHEARERDASGEGAAGRTVFDAGRVIGAAAVRLQNKLVAPYFGLIGVVGPRSMGIEQYRARPNGVDDRSPTGHEPIEVVVGLKPDDLPTDWRGYSQYQSIVWTGSGPEGDPLLLNSAQAAALREWIARGGHLVVVMPPVGQAWFGVAGNRLAELDVLPRVRVTRREGVDLGPYAYLFNRGARLPPTLRGGTVHEFEPLDDAAAGEAFIVLAGPDGAGVAARRVVGAGFVTVVGLDLGSRLLAVTNSVEADVIWHRVLGKRLNLISADQIEFERTRGPAVFWANRSVSTLDGWVSGRIAKSGLAAAGLLLAFVVFAAFWVLACPGAYFVLRRRGLKHWSWQAFAAVTLVFTAIAWGGANAIKPRTVAGRHVTFLDHVYGQPVQRARTWFNVFLPAYGDQLVTVGDGSSRGEGWTDALAPWEAPRAGSGWSAFPDSRAYGWNEGRPWSLSAPARSTVKQFRADWLGGPRWSMPTPVEVIGDGEENATRPGELRLVWPNIGRWRLEGVLVHEMPGPMRNVRIAVVKRQRELGQTPDGGLLFECEFFAPVLPDGWKPGERLDVGALTARTTADAMGDQFLRRLVTQAEPDEIFGGPAEIRAGDEWERSLALMFFDLLEGPTAGKDPPPVARRIDAHGLDLSRWFTQPCVIITGEIDGAPPEAIEVDGAAAKMEGVTVVRWVYPLPANPPAIRERTP